MAREESKPAESIPVQQTVQQAEISDAPVIKEVPLQEEKAAASKMTAEENTTTPAAMTAMAATGATGSDASTIIHEATYRRQPPPLYPRRAVELGQQGVVTLHAEVLPSGLPRTLKIAQSSGHRLLDLAALSAVRKWEFEPIAVGGHIATSWVRVPVRFVIQ